jgi:type IV secretory pathway VirB10-like protein
MRMLFQIFLFVLLMLAPASGREQQPLEDLKARAQAATPPQRVKLSLQVADRQLKAAEEAYSSGSAEQAQAAVADVALYCEQAALAARVSRKHQKDTEIHLRNIERRLEQLRRSVDFDQRPRLKSAIDRLEKARTDLLLSMFGQSALGSGQQWNGR